MDRSQKQNSQPEVSIWHALLAEALRDFFQDNGVTIPARETVTYYNGFLERGKNRRDTRPLYGEVHHASRNAGGKISIILSAEHPDDDAMVAATLIKLLAQASTPVGPGYKRELDNNLVRLGMTLPARHSVPDTTKTFKVRDAIAAALKIVGPRPVVKLTIPAQTKKPDTCRGLRLVCVGGSPEDPCLFGPTRAADSSRELIACVLHGKSTVVVWMPQADDPRQVRRGSDDIPLAAE